jgi:hypothetical protein
MVKRKLHEFAYFFGKMILWQLGFEQLLCVNNFSSTKISRQKSNSHCTINKNKFQLYFPVLMVSPIDDKLYCYPIFNIQKKETWKTSEINKFSKFFQIISLFGLGFPTVLVLLMAGFKFFVVSNFPSLVG